MSIMCEFGGDHLAADCHCQDSRIAALEAENKRLREALQTISEAEPPLDPPYNCTPGTLAAYERGRTETWEFFEDLLRKVMEAPRD